MSDSYFWNSLHLLHRSRPSLYQRYSNNQQTCRKSLRKWSETTCIWIDRTHSITSVATPARRYFPAEWTSFESLVSGTRQSIFWLHSWSIPLTVSSTKFSTWYWNRTSTSCYCVCDACTLCEVSFSIRVSSLSLLSGKVFTESNLRWHQSKG